VLCKWEPHTRRKERRRRRPLSQQHTLIVAGVIRDHGDLLLVQEQAPQDPRPFWALPGGRAEAGELVHETLIREVHEETGLEAVRVGRLLYSTQYHRPVGFPSGGDASPSTTIHANAMIFEIAQWRGQLHPNDPDAFITQARFLNLLDAITALESAPLRVMVEPLVAYLRGEVRPGAVWCYRRQADGTDVLVTRLE
jgi:ADP-ribose pyrophosphatase YjhB (NUDIX family)